MYKTKIVLDEEKIVSEDLYEITSMYEELDKLFYRGPFTKDENGWYSTEDFNWHSTLIDDMLNIGIFIKYAKVWKIWHTDDGYYENALETCQKKGIVINGR